MQTDQTERRLPEPPASAPPDERTANAGQGSDSALARMKQLERNRADLRTNDEDDDTQPGPDA